MRKYCFKLNVSYDLMYVFKSVVLLFTIEQVTYEELFTDRTLKYVRSCKIICGGSNIRALLILVNTNCAS